MHHRYLKAIEGCLTRQQLDRSERDVLDSHYTYTDEQGIGRCGPGLVIQTLAGILWSVRKGLSIFLTSRWLEMIIHPGAYSSSLGFFVMTSSLAKLENKGIVINGTRYTGVETREYSGYPQLDDADREIKNRTYHHF